MSLESVFNGLFVTASIFVRVHKVMNEDLCTTLIPCGRQAGTSQIQTEVFDRGPMFDPRCPRIMFNLFRGSARDGGKRLRSPCSFLPFHHTECMVANISLQLMLMNVKVVENRTYTKDDLVWRPMGFIKCLC